MAEEMAVEAAAASQAAAAAAADAADVEAEAQAALDAVVITEEVAEPVVGEGAEPVGRIGDAEIEVANPNPPEEGDGAEPEPLPEGELASVDPEVTPFAGVDPGVITDAQITVEVTETVDADGNVTIERVETIDIVEYRESQTAVMDGAIQTP